jgi:hypothetical protein
MSEGESIGDRPFSLTDGENKKNRRFWGESDIDMTTSTSSSLNEPVSNDVNASILPFSFPRRVTEHVIDSEVQPLSTASAHSVLGNRLSLLLPLLLFQVHYQWDM